MSDHKRTRVGEDAKFEPSRLAQWQRWILPAVAVIMFAIALAALHHLLRAYRFHDILAATRTIPADQIKLALLLTLCSYLALTGYDAVALRYVGQHVRYRRVALASFISFAVSMNLGFTPVTGSAIRYRLYSNWGLSGVDIAKLAAFSGLAFWLGFFGLAGAAFILHPTAIPGITRWPLHNTRVLGIVFLVLAYLAWTARRGAPIHIFSWRIIKPPLSVTTLAILVAACDWALAAGVLHALLPRDAGLSYFAVLHVFLLAQVVSVLSHVPGGLGVFESATVLLLHGAVPSSVLLSALLVFRVAYYLLPFIVAVALLGVNELFRRRVVAERFSRGVPGLGGSGYSLGVRVHRADFGGDSAVFGEHAGGARAAGGAANGAAAAHR